MMRLRLSISGLMVLVALAGLALATFYEANEFLLRGVVSLAIVFHATALLGWIFERRDRRPKWAGCFVFGAGSFALYFGPWYETRFAPILVSNLLIDRCYALASYRPRHPGERVWLASAYTPKHYSERLVHAITIDGGFLLSLRGDDNGWDYSPQTIPAADLRGIGPDSFRQLCHAELSVFLAFVGGLIARLFAARVEPGEDRP